MPSGSGTVESLKKEKDTARDRLSKLITEGKGRSTLDQCLTYSEGWTDLGLSDRQVTLLANVAFEESSSPVSREMWIKWLKLSPEKKQNKAVTAARKTMTARKLRNLPISQSGAEAWGKLVPPATDSAEPNETPVDVDEIDWTQWGVPMDGPSGVAECPPESSTMNGQQSRGGDWQGNNSQGYDSAGGGHH